MGDVHGSHRCIHGLWTCEACFWLRGLPQSLSLAVGDAVPKDQPPPVSRADYERVLRDLGAACGERDVLGRRIAHALAIIDQGGGVDGAHHKMWILDQVVRVLAADRYEAWVESRRRDGYDWDVGIPP